MLSEKQVSAVEKTAKELKRRRENRPAAEKPARAAPPGDANSQADEDFAWAKANLRWNGPMPMLDIANALRVLERHKDFEGRFRFNDSLGKVMDKGSVMLDWRVAEIVAVFQERFLPEISQETVEKALIVHANRVIAK